MGAGIQSARVLRLSGIFLNLHFINKPEVSFGIRDGVFDAKTGDVVEKRVCIVCKGWSAAL